LKLFHFIPFARKWLQTTPEAAEEALPNGAKEWLVVHPCTPTSSVLHITFDLVSGPDYFTYYPGHPNPNPTKAR
jgi:hypothetical protein